MRRRQQRFASRQRPFIVQAGTKEKPKSKLEHYLKYAPLAYLFLVIYSFVGLNAYYSVFGVDIISHMTIQEFLVAPLSSIGRVLFIFLGLSALTVVVYCFAKPVFGQSTWLTVFFPTTFAILIIVFVSDSLLYENYNKSGDWLYIAGTLCFIVAIFLYSRDSINWHIVYQKNQTIVLLFSLCLVTISTHYLLSKQSGSKKIKDGFPTVELLFRKTEMGTHHLNYIGETNSLVFTWDTTKMIANTWAKSEILSVTYHQLSAEDDSKATQDSPVTPANEQEKLDDLDEDCKVNDPDCSRHIP